jgi:hypothetical protein
MPFKLRPNPVEPSRDVPISIRVINLFGRSPFLGWLFFGFGLIFFWLFTLNSDFMSWYWFRGALETTKGTVLYSEGSGFGGDDDSSVTYANHYSFVGSDGNQYENVSYADYQLDKGKSVTVEYPKGRPSVSRIKGMDRAPVHPTVGAVGAVLPLIGLGFIVTGLRRGLKANRLLRNGIIARGKLISKESTGHEVYGNPVCKFTFEFTAGNERNYQVVAQTHLTDRLEDETEEPLLYDPMQPGYALMLDDLPAGVCINENGCIKVGEPVRTAFRAIVRLIFPTATVIGHGLYIYRKFFAN